MPRDQNSLNQAIETFLDPGHWGTYGPVDPKQFDKQVGDWISKLDDTDRVAVIELLTSRLQEQLDSEIPINVEEIVRFICLFREQAVPHIPLLLTAMTHPKNIEERVRRTCEAIKQLSKWLPLYASQLHSMLQQELAPYKGSGSLLRAMRGCGNALQQMTLIAKPDHITELLGLCGPSAIGSVALVRKWHTLTAYVKGLGQMGYDALPATPARSLVAIIGNKEALSGIPNLLWRLKGGQAKRRQEGEEQIRSLQASLQTPN